MATLDNNLVTMSVTDFLNDLDAKLTAIRSDFAGSSAFSNLSADQQEAFFMAIALDQYGQTGVILSDLSVIYIGN